MYRRNNDYLTDLTLFGVMCAFAGYFLLTPLCDVLRALILWAGSL